MLLPIPPPSVPALTKPHELIRETHLNQLQISIPALGSHLNRTTGPMSRLTSIPISHLALRRPKRLLKGKKTGK